MKINEDCIRDIMKLLVDDLVIFVDKKKVELGKLSIYDISSCLKNYKIEDICYSIMLLSQIKYIKGIGLDDINGRMISSIYVNEVTYDGQSFYESIKPDTIWNKTKTIVGNVGVHTLEFIESVAHDVIVASAKEATAIVVNKHV